MELVQKRWRLWTPVWVDRGITLWGIWVVGSVLQAAGSLLRWGKYLAVGKPRSLLRWKKYLPDHVGEALWAFPTESLMWDTLRGRIGMTLQSEGIRMAWGIPLKETKPKKGGSAMGREERRKILDMLVQGKITPEEAERLLEALEASSETTKPSKRGKTLLIDVNDLEDGDHVVVRIPLSLARWAIKAGIGFGGLASSQIKDPEKRKQVEEALRSLSDVDTDSLMEEISHLDELVRVDSDEAKVIIRVE